MTNLTSQIRVTKKYQCSKCGKPFVSHEVRVIHAKLCDNLLILAKAEPVHNDNPTYREALVKASKRDPMYVKYASRRNPAVPDGMTEACNKVLKGLGPVRKKKLDKLEYEDIPELNPGKY